LKLNIIINIYIKHGILISSTWTIICIICRSSSSKVQILSLNAVEIDAMSMNANMHQIALREKTLLKSYLEVDMNEFL
jgi:hypothetical protein